MAVPETTGTQLRLVFLDEWGEIPVDADWTPDTTLIDLTSALYDFNLSYELAVLGSHEQYSDYQLSNFFVLGRHRPVRRAHQLHVESVSKESPLELLTFIPAELLYAAGGATGLALLLRLRKIAELVYTIDLDLKNARLKRQIERARLQVELNDAEREVTERLRKRVENQRLRLSEASIEADEPLG